jgi:hypothetical protein
VSWESFNGLPPMARLAVAGGVIAFLLLLLFNHSVVDALLNFLKTLPVIIPVNIYRNGAKPKVTQPLSKQPN